MILQGDSAHKFYYRDFFPKEVPASSLSEYAVSATFPIRPGLPHKYRRGKPSPPHCRPLNLSSENTHLRTLLKNGHLIFSLSRHLHRLSLPSLTYSPPHSRRTQKHLDDPLDAPRPLKGAATVVPFPHPPYQTSRNYLRRCCRRCSSSRRRRSGPRRWNASPSGRRRAPGRCPCRRRGSGRRGPS